MAVAMTVPTIQRTSRVLRLAISVRTPAISVDSREQRLTPPDSFTHTIPGRPDFIDRRRSQRRAVSLMQHSEPQE